MEKQQDHINIYSESFRYFEKLEKSLASKLGFVDLTSGIQVIRNENGWRENEKRIEYIWIVTIARSFVGWGGLFSIKLNKSQFREYENPEELLQGVFISNQNGIDQIYINRTTDPALDISKIFNFDLFEANKGITLDGVSYEIRIIASNIDTFIQLHNPSTEAFNKWESEIWKLGKRLARESNNQEMMNLFEDK